MTEMTKEFVYESYESDNKTISPLGGKRQQQKETKARKTNGTKNSSNGHSSTFAFQDVELKIISRLQPSNGVQLHWRSAANLPDVCVYMEMTGLPAILKVVGGCGLFSLTKSDIILAFAHGVEMRRLCEEYDTRRCYTISSERRFADPETTDRRLSTDLWPSVADRDPGEMEKEALRSRSAAVDELRRRKRGIKYESKFLAVYRIKDEFLCQTPFLLSEDMALSFHVAVGIVGCSAKDWIEYCQAFQRYTKQSSTRQFLQDRDSRQEKLYLDAITDDAHGDKRNGIIPIHLDNYFLPPSEPHREGAPSPPSLAPSSSPRPQSKPLLPAPSRPPELDGKPLQTKRPVMGATAKQGLKTPGGFGKNASDSQIKWVAIDLQSPDRDVISIDLPQGCHSSPVRTPLRASGIKNGLGIYGSQYPTVSSIASFPSYKVPNAIKAKHFASDAISDEGYYTKSDIGVPF